MKEITVTQLAERLDAGDKICVVDVREADELEVSRLDVAIHIPLGDLPERLGELTKSDEIMLLCRSGKRSAAAAELLEENGFSDVSNVVGGINQWAMQVDDNMEIY